MIILRYSLTQELSGPVEVSQTQAKFKDKLLCGLQMTKRDVTGDV